MNLARWSLALFLALTACGRSVIFDLEDSPEPPAQVQKLILQPSELASGVVGQTYSQRLTVVAPQGAGAPDAEWTILKGALPEGLFLESLGPHVAHIFGVPTLAEKAEVTIAVRVGEQIVRANYTLEIVFADESLRLQGRRLQDGELGMNYRDIIFATGGQEPYSWRLLSGALPPGLRFQGGTRLTLLGTPSREGNYSFSVEVTDGNMDRATAEFQVRINNSSMTEALKIVTQRLPNGRIGTSYRATITATGGSEEGYRWSISSPSGSIGLRVGDRGTPQTTILGIPSVAGRHIVVVNVIDSNGMTAQAELLLTVDGELRILTETLPEGRINQGYSTAIQANVMDVLNWRLSTGSLPAGLRIEPSGPGSTTISGVPGRAGTYTFIVEASGSGAIARRTYRLVISGELEITPSTLPDGDVGLPYQTVLTAVGGLGAHTWNVVGNLPPGLTLNAGSGATAQISGVPQADGQYSFEIRVSANGQTARRQYVLRVTGSNDPLRIVTRTLEVGAVCSETNQVISAEGGSGLDYRWSVVGRLPPGLILDGNGTPSTRLHGTPTTSGSYPFSIQVSDSSGNVATANFRMPVGPEAQDSSRWVILRGDVETLGRTGYFVADRCTPSMTNPRRLTPVRSYTLTLRSARISPSGRWVVFLTDSSIRGVYELFYADLRQATLQPQRVHRAISDITKDINGFHWSPTEDKLVFWGDLDRSSDDVYLTDFTQAATPVVHRIGNFTGRVQWTGTNSFSPNGRFIAVGESAAGTSRTNFHVVDVSGPIPSAPTQINPPLGPVDRVRTIYWSPMSDVILYTANIGSSTEQELHRVALNSAGQPTDRARLDTRVPNGTNHFIRSVAISPSGRFTAFVTSYRTTSNTTNLRFTVAHYAGPGQVTRSTPMVGQGTISTTMVAQWSPIQDTLLAIPNVSSASSIYLLTTSGNQISQVQEVMGTNGRHVSGYSMWSPDGSKVLYRKRGSGGRSELEILNVNSNGTPGTIQSITGSSGNLVTTHQWSPDSHRIVIAGNFRSGTANELYVYTLGSPGLPQMVNFGRSGRNFGVAKWSSAGSSLVANFLDNSNRRTAFFINAADPMLVATPLHPVLNGRQQVQYEDIR